MIRVIFQIIDRIFTVFFAFLFLQIPSFMKQYEMQLTGHVNELKLQVTNIERIAKKSGKTLSQYINKFVSHDDLDFSDQGQMMISLHKRWEKLSEALMRLKDASAFTKLFYFIAFCQWDIVKTSINSYEPGLIFSLESLIYGLVGLCFGYFLFFMLSSLIKKRPPVVPKQLEEERRDREKC